jgi:hypothetical protein
VRVACDGGVEAHGHRRGLVELARDAGDVVELLERLDVDRPDAGLEAGADLRQLLADAREDDPVGRESGAQALRELAAGDDVGPEPLSGR